MECSKTCGVEHDQKLNANLNECSEPCCSGSKSEAITPSEITPKNDKKCAGSCCTDHKEDNASSNCCGGGQDSCSKDEGLAPSTKPQKGSCCEEAKPKPCCVEAENSAGCSGEGKAPVSCCGEKESACCDEKKPSDCSDDERTNCCAINEKKSTCCDEKKPSGRSDNEEKNCCTRNDEISTCCDEKTPSGCSNDGKTNCCTSNEKTPSGCSDNEKLKCCTSNEKKSSGCSDNEKLKCCTSNEQTLTCCDEKKPGGSSDSNDKISACCDEKKPSGCSDDKKTNCCTSNEVSSTCCDEKKPSGCSDNEKTNRCIGNEKMSTCCDEKKASGCSADEKMKCCTGDKNPTSCCNEGDSCCGESTTTSISEDPVDCCAGVKQVTCSAKKAIQVVDRETKSSCCEPKKEKGRPSAPSGNSEACETHLQKAFREYASYLEKGRCICRNVLDGLDKCCGQPVAKKRALRPSTAAPATSKEAKIKTKPAFRGASKSSSCSAPCCGEANLRSRGKNLKIAPTSSIEEMEVASTPPSKRTTFRADTVDIEKGAAREHVLLSVSGMTCTGCSKKLTNVLNNVEGLSSVKVTFVTGMAEFDLEQDVAELPQVISRIEKETGFKFSPILSNYQSLDLRIDSPLAEKHLQYLKDLLESVEKLGKTTYRVNYDPNVIGARSILSSVRGASLAPPAVDAKLTNDKRKLMQKLWLFIASACLTIPVVVLAWSKAPVPYATSSVVSLVLATLVQGLAIPEFYVGAVKALVYSRVIEMDMLVVISVTGAYGYSVVAFALTHAGIKLQTTEFFETSTLLITLVILGRLVASFAKVKAVSTVSMRSLQVERAALVQETGSTEEIDARLLQFGDELFIPAYSRIVTDGEVTQWSGWVDESMITGESMPVRKAPGSMVIAGTMNGPSPLTIRVTRLPGSNSITDIAKLVENSLASKPHIQDLADKLAGYFTPAIILVSSVVFAIWIAVALRIRMEAGGNVVGTAISYGIAVMAISCPCALGLAVPMVLRVAGGAAARKGVIIRQADALERGHKVTDIIFDKTGTLSDGKLEVVKLSVWIEAYVSEAEAFAITRALTQNSQHPVSQVIASKLSSMPGCPAKVENIETIPGSGIQCSWKGFEVKGGNPHWLGIERNGYVEELLDQGITIFCLTVNSTLVAAWGLKSSLRKEAIAVIEGLHQQKINCHIVSGDNHKVVEDVAGAVGIPLAFTASQQTPAQKQLYVKELMDSGKIVLFCGDGTNDAAAITQANVGVQIGDASDVTRAIADVVLLGGLEGIPELLGMSKRAFRRIVFNFAWCVIYNTFAILLAAGAFVKARIPPAYAGLGEIVSVSPVIIAALTLVTDKWSKAIGL